MLEDPTGPLRLPQVETPNFGSTHRVNTMYAARIRIISSQPGIGYLATSIMRAKTNEVVRLNCMPTVKLNIDGRQPYWYVTRFSPFTTRPMV